MKKLMKKIAALLVSSIMMLQLCATSVVYAVDNDNVNSNEAVVDSDDYIKVIASKDNGGFLIQTKEGNKLEKNDNNKHLLFSDESYDTSFTSFRITDEDGKTKDYIFGREYGFFGKDSEMLSTEVVTNTITSKWQLNDLIFTQKLTVLNSENAAHGMVEILYEVENTGNTNYKNIEARVLLDTALGDQDFGYYEIPQAGSSNGENYRTIEKEQICDNTNNALYENLFFCYDDKVNPTIRAYTLNANIGSVTVAPTQVAFGHWQNLAKTVFEFVPEKDLTFTNPYNLENLTADSAYALYYDMGEVSANETSVIATNYGLYSNHTNNADSDVIVNFTKVAPAMEKLEDADGKVYYGNDGKFDIALQLQNNSDKTLTDVSVKYTLQPGVYYNDTEDKHTVHIGRINPMGNVDTSIDLMATATNAITDYRTIVVEVYDGETLIAEKETYVLCPGIGTDSLTVNSVTPEIIYTQQERQLFLSISGVGALKDKGAYSVIMTNKKDTSKKVTIKPENIYISSASNSMVLTFDNTMAVGEWDIKIDFNSDDVKDITSDKLNFIVSEDQKYMSNTYGVVTVERESVDGDGRQQYQIKIYDDQEDYDKNNTNQNNLTLLEFKGIFKIEEGTKENPKKLVGISEKMLDGTMQNTMSISNCLDVEDGSITITDHMVDYEDGKKSTIDVDIDGKVYTTGAKTSVWKGVCCLTSIIDGNTIELIQYDNLGEVVGEVENTVGNTEVITLLWPGAGGEFMQTVAGMLLEFRFAQFGQLSNEHGDVDDDTDKTRIIAFGAQLDPSLLLPASFVANKVQLSSLEKEQERLRKVATTYYESADLRRVNEKHAKAQEAYEDLANTKLGLYVNDILFGGGFIGFNTSIDLGLPPIVDGFPGVEGNLNLKVINKEWGFGIEGSADLGVFEMEGQLVLKSYNSIPVLDTAYFYAGGFTPGINVDGHGIFWIRGAGGGFSDLYESIFSGSKVPKLTLMVKGQFALFSVLSATAEISASLRGVSGTISDIGLSVGGVKLDFVKELTLSANWYPELMLYAGLHLSFFDAIEGKGYVILEEDRREGTWFYEGYANASLHVPENIPVVGELEIGNVGLGLNADKVWGGMEVLKVGLGLSYTWGDEKVKFELGKFEMSEPTYDLMRYQNPNTIIAQGTNGVQVAMVNPIVKVVNVVNTATNTVHQIPVLPYTENKDILTTVKFNATSAEAAKTIAKAITLTNGTEKRELVWDLDLDDDADDIENADALLKSMGNGEYQAIISFTEQDQFGKTWELTTIDTESKVEYYEVERLAGIDNVTISNNETVTVTGDLDAMETLSVYAESQSNSYLLSQANDIELSGNSKTMTLEVPINLPSGDYTIKAVGKTRDKTSNPIVNANDKFRYTNPNQPSNPSLSQAKLGGDYTIDVPVIEDTDCDGYYATVYEQNEKGEWVATDIANLTFDKEEVETDVLTVGGQFETYQFDEDGNIKKDANGNELFEKYGLFADKKYRVGVSSYKAVDITVDGEPTTIAVKSAEVFTDAMTMVKPLDTKLTLTLENSTDIENTTAQAGPDTFSYPTTTSEDVTITVSSTHDLSTAKYRIDGSDFVDCIDDLSISINDLESGMHTLYVQGENKQGDAVHETMIFNIDNVAPVLLLSTQTQGFFNQDPGLNFVNSNGDVMKMDTIGDTLTIKGSSEEGCTLNISVEDKITQHVIGKGGEFSVEAKLDVTQAYQFVKVWVQDKAGNISKTVSMPFVNEALSNEKVKYDIYIDEIKVTDKPIPTSGGKLSLKGSVKDKTITINDDSKVVANKIEFGSVVDRGMVTIEDAIVKSITDDALGTVSADVGDNKVSAIIGAITSDTPAPDAYSVEVYWGAMDFTYHEEQKDNWNTTDLVYDDITPASWTAKGNSVTVKNMSMKEVSANFTYSSTETFTDVTGDFDKNDITLYGCQGVEIGKEDEVTSTLTLAGDVAKEDVQTDSTGTQEPQEPTQVGTVTVVIDKADDPGID